MSLIGVLLTLSFLVIIHELGHYLAALWAKVKVEEFGLGYPPLAKKLFTKWGTDFSLNWVPFGGFVRMAGEQLKPEDKPRKGDFAYTSKVKRMVIILAGVTINFIFGILAFTVIYSVDGIPVEISSARIDEIAVDSPAETAGLPTNVDIVGLKIGDEFTPVSSVDDAVEFIQAHPGETVQVAVSGPCQGVSCAESISYYEVYLRTPEETPVEQGSLGVAFTGFVTERYPWYEMPFRSTVVGVRQSLAMSQAILVALGDMVSGISQGEVPEEVAGPIGIVYQVDQMGIFKLGPMMILAFAGMLSINLAVINLLPIPPLDGGRAVLTIAEAIFGRSKTAKVEYYLNYTGYVLLIGLIILVTIKDIWQIVGQMLLK